MSIVLPTKPLPKETSDPRNLIIYGNPKVGKTSLLSTLDNALIFDLEAGTKFLEALKINISNYQELIEVCKEIKKAGCPYKFIAIDTITALEEMAKPLALNMFKQTPLGMNDKVTTDVTTLPHGAGYGFLRLAVEKLIDIVSKVCENTIIVGHVKDKALGDADSSDIGSTLMMDVTGKLGRILSARSDAIGFVHRDADDNLCINFMNNGEATAGARPEHLANKDIVVATRNEDGTFTSHWDRIYPSLIK